jgi:sugar phosphate isomerase/epimerase
MEYTRRELGALALAAVPGLRLLDKAGAATDRPRSLFGGVTIGVITYSYRGLPDQTADAVLKYVVDSGIGAIELMGSVAEGDAGAPPAPRVPRDRPATPEEDAARKALKAWRLGASMDRFKALRARYEAAGVRIYAVKIQNPDLAEMSDEEREYVFDVAEALGCTHTTLELPAPGDAGDAALSRIGELAVSHKVYAAYHTHTQGSMTAFDRAFALSPGNMANVDFGHFVAGGNVGGTPVQFLERFHGRIASFHLKDRQTPEHGAGNLPWGTGDTPIRELLRTVRKNRWTMPATVELEYAIPAGSDAVAEVRKCVEYCRTALS